MCCARGAGWGAEGRPGPFLPSRSLHVLPARGSFARSLLPSLGRPGVLRPSAALGRDAGGGGPDQGPAGRGRREDSLARVQRCKGHTSLVWAVRGEQQTKSLRFPLPRFPSRGTEVHLPGSEDPGSRPPLPHRRSPAGRACVPEGVGAPWRAAEGRTRMGRTPQSALGVSACRTREAPCWFPAPVPASLAPAAPGRSDFPATPGALPVPADRANSGSPDGSPTENVRHRPRERSRRKPGERCARAPTVRGAPGGRHTVRCPHEGNSRDEPHAHTRGLAHTEAGKPGESGAGGPRKPEWGGVSDLLFLGPFCTLQNNSQLCAACTCSKGKSTWKSNSHANGRDPGQPRQPWGGGEQS